MKAKRQGFITGGPSCIHTMNFHANDCLLQTWCYPARSNLVHMWDAGDLLSMSSTDSSQPVTIRVVGVMMAIKWLDPHVSENNSQGAPTKELSERFTSVRENVHYSEHTD